MASTASGDGQPDRTADQWGQAGAAGETHQVADGTRPRLTTQQGVVVGDDQNTLRAGERGPALLEDFHFREKIFHFDHERIPERVVHARGTTCGTAWWCGASRPGTPRAPTSTP